MKSAWLMLAVTNGRQHAGNLGYEDDPERTYAWDDTVPNYEAPEVGDVVAIWDKRTLLGVSVVDEIRTGQRKKPRLRCPSCRRTSIKVRVTKSPQYRCHNPECREEFETPVEERIEVVTYATEHHAGWVELDGLIDGPTLRSLCTKPGSMHSIRALDWKAFKDELEAQGASDAVRILKATQERHRSGGHGTATVRVRKGQAGFRRDLLDLYGPTCAFLGSLPPAVLDAAHLYSYSEVGRHDVHGGLLIRKDLHRLFDLGAVVVEPETCTIRVSAELRAFSDYAVMHGRSLALTVEKPVVDWLRLHWREHRA